MWPKDFRFLVFVGVYSFLFWEVEFDKTEFTINDLDKLKLLFFTDSDFSDSDVEEALSFVLKIQNSESKYKTNLLNYLKEWDKTYLLTQSILFTFLGELEDIQTKKTDMENIVGKYIRLTQEMVGGQSTALVHAVTSKIIEEKLNLID